MNIESNKLYPLKFKPILKQKLWGGDRIQNIYRHNEPKLAQVGESWDVSAMDDDDCEVINGWLEGNSLADLVEVYMGDLVGDKVYEQYGSEFPLLLKIIDANDNLSIQVHPNDELAEEEHGLSGKTEMWYVLDADIILGFNRYVSKSEYIERVATGHLEEVLQKYPVKKGDVYFIPAGMVHSIGKGCLILEIQEPTDFTIQPERWCNDYHISYEEEYIGLDKETALGSINYDIFGENAKKFATVTPKIAIDTENYQKQELITYEDTPCFAENRHIIKKGGSFTLNYAPSVWLLLDGDAIITGENYYREVNRGEYFYLPFVAEGKFSVTTNTQATFIECLPSKQD